MKQLRFTTTKPMGMFEMIQTIESTKLLVDVSVGELITEELKGKSAYIHGKAEKIAKFDVPIFLDGNIAQLALPIDEQDILMLLPEGQFKCKSEFYDSWGAKNCYLITLFDEPSTSDKL